MKGAVWNKLCMSQSPRFDPKIGLAFVGRLLVWLGNWCRVFRLRVEWIATRQIAALLLIACASFRPTTGQIVTVDSANSQMRCRMPVKVERPFQG